MPRVSSQTPALVFPPKKSSLSLPSLLPRNVCPLPSSGRQRGPRSPSLFTAPLAPCASTSEPSKCDLLAMRSVTSPILQRPVLTIPPGRAAGWHQRIGMCETLPAPKCVAFRKDLPQPLWELRLNPDYGTLPGIPLLEALQSVGVLGADVPAYLDRAMSMNIYVSGPPATLPEGRKSIGHPAEMDLIFCSGYLIARTCF
jgi:hypothetical protein